MSLSPFLQGLGSIGVFASRAFLPDFVTALLLRFGANAPRLAHIGLIPHIQDVPTWFTSDTAPVILGIYGPDRRCGLSQRRSEAGDGEVTLFGPPSNGVAVGASSRTGVLGTVDGDPLRSSRYPKGYPASRDGGGAMPADHTTLPVLAVIFLATVIRSAFGFGEALVAVPLLALIIPVEVAAPVAVLVSVTVAGLVLVQDWREVHAGSAGRLILSTLFGIPFGLLLLTTVAEPVVKAVLAAVIIAFSVYRLVGRSRFELEDDRLAWLFGFGAGVLGGAYGMNGPPLVAYGALRRWSPERFRATLQGYFLPASLVGMVGYWVAGLWVPAVTRYYLTSLPVVLAATVLGRVLNRRMDGRRFLALRPRRPGRDRGGCS